MKKNLLKILLLFFVTVSVSLHSCMDDDITPGLEKELEAIQKDVMTLQELFQLQLDDFAKRIEDVQAAWNEMKTRYTALNVPVIQNPVGTGYLLSDETSLQNALDSMAAAITALENIVNHGNHGNVALANSLASLRTALYNATGSATDAALQDSLKEAYDRAILLTDEYINGLIADFLLIYKVTEANLDTID